MSSVKRARACDHCHSIKIRCELGSVGGAGPCERCVRLGKECKVTPPKTQKDRVAELEAQVQQLTKLLEAQNMNSTQPQNSSQSEERDSVSEPSPTANLPASLASQKKRKLDDTAIGRISSSTVDSNDVLARLDAIIDRQTQSALVERYINEVFKRMPLVPIAGNSDYESLRNERPTLLLAALYAASTGVLSEEVHNEVAKVNWDNLTRVAMSEEAKSLEVIQAIQATYLYYRSPRHHTHVSVFDLIAIAQGMADEMGLAGPIVSIAQSETRTWSKSDAGFNDEEAWRVWIVCRILSSTSCLFLRRPNTFKWSEHEEISLQMMDYWQESIPGALLVCQISKAEKLNERIAAESGFHDLDSFTSIYDAAYQTSRFQLQSAVLDFQTAIIPRLDSEMISFFKLTTTIYLHEPVLHTSTNKRSFKAPYLAEGLSVSDFPIPVVTQDHINSLQMLKSSCHALLDTFLGWDSLTQALLPGVLVTARVAFAQFLLMKIYIATTAPGNTFGAFFDSESLLLEQYFERMISASLKVSELDDRSGPARVMDGSTRMKDWYHHYRDTYLSAGLPVSENAAQSTSQTTFDAGETEVPWTNYAEDGTQYALGLEEVFADSWV